MVGEIPLAAQRVEHSHTLVFKAERERQRLDQRHVMARAVRVRTEAVRHERRQGDLGDGTVRGVETRLRADRGDTRIGKAALRR